MLPTSSSVESVYLCNIICNKEYQMVEATGLAARGTRQRFRATSVSTSTTQAEAEPPVSPQPESASTDPSAATLRRKNRTMRDRSPYLATKDAKRGSVVGGGVWWKN